MDGQAGARGTVAAILVAHDGAAWLPKVLTSLSSMDVAPVAWHAVDVSSTDGSADYLRQSFGASRISFAAAGTGFGAAVSQAVEQLPQTDWLWLLHDDAIVTPSTLSGLLAEATSSPDIAAVGPKVREWPSLVRLLEVGVTVTGTGHRYTGLETGEPDAGQYDRARTVLAVSSAGMLVRREAWEELGGFDPNLPLYFDDIDFGWRATRAGYRIRTAPLGVIFHAEASARHSRTKSAGDVPTWERRRAAIYTVLANAERWRFPLLYVRMFFGSLLRVVGFLIDRDPEDAGDELLALRDVYGRRGHLRAARRARAPFALRPHREIAKLLPAWWLPYRQGLDSLRETVSSIVKPESVETVGRRSVLGDQSPEEVEELDDGPSILARRPWFSAVVVLAIASLVAGRGLLGGDLHGLALPPAPETAGGWWSLIFGRFHDVGGGSTAFGPTFALVLAGVSTPLWWWPGIVVQALMLFSVPLAAMTAHRLGRSFLPDRPVRIGWAIAYALLVVGSGAVAQGRIGTVVALIVAPIIVNTLIQLVTDPGWQVGLRLGIWIAVAAAFAPVMFWLSAVGLVAVALWGGAQARRPVFVAASVSILLLGPWFIQRVIHPMRLWWEAGHPVPGSADIVDVLLGAGGGAGAAPVGLTAVIIALAVLALIPAATRPQVWLAWIVALIGLAAAVVGLAITYGTPSGQDGITPWVGACAVIWIGGLSAAVAIALPEVELLPRPIAAVLVIAALAAPIGLASWWLVRGVDKPLEAKPPEVVPAYLAAQEGRTLVLTGTFDTGVDVRVVSGDGPHLGEEAVVRGGDVAARAMRDLLTSPYSDGAAELAKHGISAVYAPDPDDKIEARMDAVPTFAPSGSDSPTSRVWLIDADEPAVGKAGAWRWAWGAVHTLAWLVAVILTAPVRRREQPGELIDDTPFVGEIRPVAQ